MSTLHMAARKGDLEEVSDLLDSGTPVDARDENGFTALMHACVSPDAGLEMVQLLLDRGADLEAEISPPPVDQPNFDLLLEDEDLTDDVREALENYQAIAQTEGRETPLMVLAVKEASIEKLRLLFENGADPTLRNRNGYTLMIHACYSGRVEVIDLLLEIGAPVDGVSDYSESALSVLSRRGRFETVAKLLEAGADPSPLGWSPLHFAVVFGTVEEVKDHLARGDDVEARDRWDRTTLLLAIHAGELEKARILLAGGAVLEARGRCGRPALTYPIDRDDVAMLRWLLDQGCDVDAVDEFGATPYMNAAEEGAIGCFRALDEAGADWTLEDHVGETVGEKVQKPELVRLMIAKGFDPSRLQTEVLRSFIGLGAADELPVSEAEFNQGRRRRFGRSVPEVMEIPFWKAMVRNGWSGWRAGQIFGYSSFSRGEPVWCHDRFGMSLTPLPDGRFVQIGGEHEDYYDPDFCIYNEVIVHDGNGDFDILGYPEESFPPTDFHSATLVPPWIYVIGNLGYPKTREAFEYTTPVFRFHLDSWAVERVEISGESPGWIHGHRAGIRGQRIEISGGNRVRELEDGDEETSVFPERWALCLETRTWRRKNPEGNVGE